MEGSHLIFISYQRLSYQIVTFSLDLLLNCQLPSYPQLHFVVFLFIHLLVILCASSLILRQTCVFNLATQKKGAGYLRIIRGCLQRQQKSKGIIHVS